ncbi:hypothetical protein [Moorena sp. SIO2C4]|nr:hypothetical protein [Moorena sp. SIO2C4]NES40286.1 hypothetical protein [Moorena sp. SIO2C4]
MGPGRGECGNFCLIAKLRCTLPVPCSRFPIPDSRFPIPDSRFPIPDSRI